MSFFDRFLSKIKGAAVPAANAPVGPLGLKVGDRLAYYQETFQVAGVRVLEAPGEVRFLYCLRDAEGTRAVLAAHEGDADGFSLQRVLGREIDWTAQVVEDVAEEPLSFRREGQCRVRTAGDSGVEGSRQVKFREYADEDGDEVLLLEDYGVRREARHGEPVSRAELELHPCEETADPNDATGDVDPPESVPTGPTGKVRKGSPFAAAMALSGQVQQEAAPDDDPDHAEEPGYVDADWDDASDAAAPAARGLEETIGQHHFASTVAAAEFMDEDEDEDWVRGA